MYWQISNKLIKISYLKNENISKRHKSRNSNFKLKKICASIIEIFALVFF